MEFPPKFLRVLASFALLAFVSAQAQNTVVGDEQLRWKAAEERLEGTFRTALQMLNAPHTRAIQTALENSQKDWLRHRQSLCLLEATTQAFNSVFDERNARRCESKEAIERTKFIQNLVP
jgi:uncharacterized protein YecT (DUF1311 family)